MGSRTRRGRLILVAYVLAMLVAFLAPIPATSLDETGGVDKSVHLLLFVGFGFLHGINYSTTLVRAVLLSTAFAVAIEVAQSMLWYRSGDPWDAAAGVVGAAAGAYLSRHASR